MKYLLAILFALLLPFSAQAAIAATWTATSTDAGYIKPNLINGNNPNLYIAGNVGIGISNPNALLELAGSDATSYSATAFPKSRIRVQNTSTTDNNFAEIGFATTDSGGSIANGSKIDTIFTSHAAGAVSADFALTLRRAGTLTEALRIKSTGAVGIGLTNPGSTLEVQGTTTDSTANAFIAWNSANTNLFEVRNDGNVGIASSTPGSLLSIGGSTNGINFSTGTSTFSTTGGIQAPDFCTSTKCLSSIISDTNYFTNIGASTYLSTGTNLGIGTTSPAAPLTVSGTAGTIANPQIIIGNQSGPNYGEIFLSSAGVMEVTNAGATAANLILNGSNNLSLSDAGATRFQLNGSVFESINAAGPYFLNGACTSATAPVIAVDQAQTGAGFGCGTAGNITALAGGAEVSRWTPTGFGVGTTSPFGVFAVSTTTQGAANLPLFTVASTTNATILSVLGGGNVGIGTNAPTTPLQVVLSGTALSESANVAAVFQANATTGANVSLDIESGNTGLDLINFGRTNSENAGAISYSNSGGNFAFRTNGVANQMDLTATGLLGIGSSTPQATLTVVAASSTVPTGKYTGLVEIIAGLENTVTMLFQEIDQWGHIITSGDTTTVSGGTSTVSGNDRNGTITVTGVALTSVTMTFAHAWVTAPECVVSDNTTASVADVSSVSTTQVVFGLSVGINSGALYYICMDHQ